MNTDTQPHISDLTLAYALLRFGLGINFFMHGLSRVPNLATFISHTEKMFAKTWLPLPVVLATGYAIPFIELALGAALILGLFLRPVLVIAFLFMSMLTFGVCLAQNWSVASEQLIYMIGLALLLAGARYNRFAVGRATGSASEIEKSGKQLGSG
ncbi:MAG: DoxX family protein [Chthoniobacterales bacterium]